MEMSFFDFSDIFLPQNYVPLLGKYILECLQRCHDSLMKAQDCSLEFISRLLGKLCLKGFAGSFIFLFSKGIFVILIILFIKVCHLKFWYQILLRCWESKTETFKLWDSLSSFIKYFPSICTNKMYVFMYRHTLSFSNGREWKEQY